ncbi:hypothetical protein PCH_Pc17g00510 [Penicillium rubens Wisconsin 54-1255]|uniref:Uncharacterized protein n=1 Tax=Penicillium rubens (strain ATCC 28089 / DSM 1075 / NRRL 1951 / Wisconsin 54-1255) TaxID=500485 RepID=B6HAX9_PENRW|nr:hypothetical protein PCH_Pc17g00510 [Penicillium rubens Wisconsin 54-1255]
MLLRALDKQAIKNTRSAPSTMPRQRQIIFQPISRIEVTAIAFREVLSQVHAINHALLLKEHGISPIGEYQFARSRSRHFGRPSESNHHMSDMPMCPPQPDELVEYIIYSQRTVEGKWSAHSASAWIGNACIRIIFTRHLSNRVLHNSFDSPHDAASCMLEAKNEETLRLLLLAGGLVLTAWKDTKCHPRTTSITHSTPAAYAA